MRIIATTGLLALFVLTGALSEAPYVSAEIKVAELGRKEGKTYSVALTGYNAVPEQTDDSPEWTASGAYSNPEIIVARSVDLAGELPFGTVIRFKIADETSKAPCGLSEVEHLVGLRVVADSMHPRKRNQLDILFDNKDMWLGKKQINPAVILGTCKDIEVEVVGHVDIAKIPSTQTELKIAVGEHLLAMSR